MYSSTLLLYIHLLKEKGHVLLGIKFNVHFPIILMFSISEKIEIPGFILSYSCSDNNDV